MNLILVPGFWLGAWSWDNVTPALVAAGHHVNTLTLPGLDSVDSDRSAIGLADRVYVHSFSAAAMSKGTPDTAAEFEKLADDGVNGVISDRPDLARAELATSVPSTASLK